MIRYCLHAHVSTYWPRALVAFVLNNINFTYLIKVNKKKLPPISDNIIK